MNIDVEALVGKARRGFWLSILSSFGDRSNCSLDYNWSRKSKLCYTYIKTNRRSSDSPSPINCASTNTNIHMTNSDLQVWKGQKVKSRPKVSVIMPAYNVAQYIPEALDSVFRQSFRDFEVIVVNDGSPDTDELERVLEPYRDEIVYAKQRNAGVSAARNTAVRLANSPFIAQLDPDDAWLPEYLEVQMELMLGDPTLDVLYPNTIIFGDTYDSGSHGMSLSPSDGEVTFESVLSQKCNVLACVVARRDTLIRVGLFDESLKSSEDFDMWIRILKSGGRIGYHRRVLARYRRRRDSLSASPIVICKSVLQTLAKLEHSLTLTDGERESLSQSRFRFEAMLSLHEGKKAFFEGNHAAAIERLRNANRYYRSVKISVSLALLGIAPNLMLTLYNARDRFVFRANTKY